MKVKAIKGKKPTSSSVMKCKLWKRTKQKFYKKKTVCETNVLNETKNWRDSIGKEWTQGRSNLMERTEDQLDSTQ